MAATLLHFIQSAATSSANYVKQTGAAAEPIVYATEMVVTVFATEKCIRRQQNSFLRSVE